MRLTWRRCPFVAGGARAPDPVVRILPGGPVAVRPNATSTASAITGSPESTDQLPRAVAVMSLGDAGGEPGTAGDEGPGQQRGRPGWISISPACCAGDGTGVNLDPADRADDEFGMVRTSHAPDR
ncbi:MAG: hypothetical protein ACRDUW_00180 [Pseudonocardiaceae bacterium]